MAGGEKKKKKKRSDRSRSRSPRRRDKSPRERRSSTELSGSDSEPGKRSKRRNYKDSDRSKDKKKEKDYYKSLETPEEKRARRLAKKEAKDKKRRKQMGWNNEYEGYTNTDNPFGDAHFLETFVWHKKEDQHGEDLNDDEKRMHDKKRQMERKKQLERVRQRRAEREREMVLREEEKERMQRDKESNYYSEWEKQEDKFHLEQATLRSKIRIQDGRAKPIDLLAQYISTEDENLDIQMHEPYTILVGLTQGDLSDLLEDIKVYMELEQGKNTEYWQDITLICKDELQNLKKQVHDDQLVRREGIHSEAHSDVAATFKGKTYSQLIALEKRIYSKISSGEAVDIGFWESLLQQLKVYMAKARLKERHQRMLREKLTQLRQQKEETTESTGEIELSESDSEPEKVEVKTESFEEPPAEEKQESEEPSTSKSWRDDDDNDDDDDDKTESNKTEEPTVSLFTEEDLLEESYQAYNAGNYSPKLIKTGDVEENLIMDPEEDWQKLLEMRQYTKEGGSVLVQTLRPSAMEEEEARKGLGPDEETFNVAVPLSSKKYGWEDKYRPRKPRFFNRVHTGYEWNKYNQTHYDSDNPPPKIVQGYKFNIFYPDLIEKTIAPEYHLEPSASDSQDFGILRFHAGPPYEDIAFKIVNREWEYSHRKGFRCQFHNNIFQLWFHFKRYRYRR